MKKLLSSVIFPALVLAVNAHAVLVYNGTSANLSAPSDDPGWDAVATIYRTSPSTDPATAIFLGNEGGFGWFLTANHVNLSSATLTIGGNDYTAFSSITQIGTIDLKVFRVNTTIAGITPVTLSSTVPNVNASVTMVGYGKTGTYTTWDTSNNPWTSPGGGAEGYEWSNPNVKSWGTNTVLERNINTASGMLLATDFDNVAGEAQGSLGDSGGAVFRKTGMNWELAAVIIAVGRVENSTLSFSNFAGQPSNTSVAGITGEPNNKSTTYAVQIANYRTNILNAIPEPGLAGFAAALLSLYLVTRRREARVPRSG